MRLLEISDRLAAALHDLSFGLPVAYVYNPLVYARAAHRRFLTLSGTAQRETLLVGMNPGPWGMAQNGVPFGTVSLVRDWLGIDGVEIGKPPEEHPKRPVAGMGCPREEVSGARFWGWARDAFGTPAGFFSRFHVTNYCPLLFLEASGRNRTPDKLSAAERAALLPPCDRALRQVAETLGVRRAIGIGVYAEQRIRASLEGMDVTVGRILHPSPASPLANRGWAAAASVQLRDLGISLP